MALEMQRTPSGAGVPGRYRFTVAEFRRMAEAGILTGDDRVELVEGEIIEMSPIGKRHAAVVARLNVLFNRLAENVVPWVQNPVELGGSEFYPDLALLEARPDFYADAVPKAGDILLLVEVSDTSLAYDQQVKAAIYAKEGVPELWIVDLSGEKVWVYRKPSPDGYLEMRALARGEMLDVQKLSGATFGVDGVLGQAA